MRSFLSSRVFSVILLIAVPTAVYFINVEVQSYLGRQALAGTGLESLTLAKALDEAKNNEKLVLVDVSAIWCSTCRKLDNEVFSDPGVREVIRRDFVFSRLEYETEEGQRFLEERNTSGFPNLWVIDGEGRTVSNLPVTFDPKKFAARLEAAAGQSR